MPDQLDQEGQESSVDANHQLPIHHKIKNKLPSERKKLIPLIIALVALPLVVIVALTRQNLLGSASTLQASTQPPTGYFDVLDTSSWKLKGWAYDSDMPDVPIDVQVYVEGPAETGYLIGSFKADQNRSDLPGAGIPANHGFSIDIPERLRSNYHTFYVYATDPADGAKTQLNKSPKTMGTKSNADSSITATVKGSPLTITTTQRLSGAIHSLKWKGKEFINSYDHGRQLQTAMAFDLLGECYNPTEAGGRYDGKGDISSSVLNFLSASGNKLTTIISPAYWLKPGTAYVHPNTGKASCDGNFSFSNLSEAQNTSIVSDYFIKKDVEIGYLGLDNVINYVISISSPRNHGYAIFEALTGYMPPEFSSFYAYDPAIKQLTSITPPTREQFVPIIVSTTDSAYAMGVYASPETNPKNPRYGASTYVASGEGNSTSKWNCVYHKGQTLNSRPVADSVLAGDYQFTCFVIVGTLTDVQNSMSQLYGYLSGTTQPPTPTPTSSVTPASQILTLAPSADAHVRADQPGSNFGQVDFVQTDSSPQTISYFKFNLNSLVGRTIKKATITFKIRQVSVGSHTLRRASSSSWSETGLTYNNRPSFEATNGTVQTPSTLNSTISYTVTNGVDAYKGKNVTFGLVSDDTDVARFYSREAALGNRPQLIVEYQ